MGEKTAVYEHFTYAGTAGGLLVYVGDDNDYSIASITINKRAFSHLSKVPDNIVVHVLYDDQTKEKKA